MILYPIIGYIISLLGVVFMELGFFMWLFLIAGSILFFGGIFCANGIIGEYKKGKKIPEELGGSSETDFSRKH
jgi:hypothetical protein